MKSGKSVFMNEEKPITHRKRGVVGVIFRAERLLIIRRSLTVAAPGKLCLPGGGIESGESESDALVREMQEELAIDVAPIRLCWRSVTDWGTELAWWLAHLDHDITPIANPEEVAEVHWMQRDEIRTAHQMLPSLPTFLDAWERGEIDLTV
ncbi:MAG: NUDIX hydrolase [Rubripirellula sp.]